MILSHFLTSEVSSSISLCSVSSSISLCSILWYQCACVFSYPFSDHRKCCIRILKTLYNPPCSTSNESLFQSITNHLAALIKIRIGLHRLLWVYFRKIVLKNCRLFWTAYKKNLWHQLQRQKASLNNLIVESVIGTAACFIYLWLNRSFESSIEHTSHLPFLLFIYLLWSSVC